MLKRSVYLLFLVFLLLLSCEQAHRSVSEFDIFVDDLGRQVKLPKRVERVVSLAPSLTEIIFAVKAEDKLVGVTTYCDFPEPAREIEKVGDTIRPSLERIISLKPDVVFVSTASQLEGFVRLLEQKGISVFVTNPSSIEKILENIEVIGKIVERDNEAQSLVEQLRKRIERVEEKSKDLSRPRVFVQIDKSLFTVGKDSFITDLIRKAGGISVTENIENSYPKVSKETALSLNPEVIILPDSPDNGEPNEVFSNSDAVRNGRVYKINSDVLSRPGPRIVDALEQVSEMIHGKQ
ncbi:MAG: cobalamin-binding protein [Pyrinomonadaceae bacterium]|nr:cobalamin-binding protein [Pyrinomonadaceae bacterium]MCX7639728.1 cobalamin-binding protein [Pyrinomonadaceae bacterium]MDW8304311.1 cobalamin-binding protein [Acidobacteriota bacterium]